MRESGHVMSSSKIKNISFLLLSGGIGARANHREPKQFYSMCGHPMIAYPIIAISAIPEIKEIIINAPEGYEERTREIMDHYTGTIPFKVVKCGETRQESSLILANAATYETVILHESARPCAERGLFQGLVDCDSQNAGYFRPVPFSMVKVDSETQLVTEGVAREGVFDVQMPQKFQRSTLLQAHDEAIEKGREFTEDSLMVYEMTGEPVASLSGSSHNIKITSSEDFTIGAGIVAMIKGLSK